MSIHRLAAGVLLAVLASSASAAAPAPAQPAAAPVNPIKVLLLPSDIKIISIGVATTDESTDDSARMTAATDAALHTILANSRYFKLLAMPTLSADEQALLKQHVALYRIEAEDAYGFSVRGGVWKDALADFDYSIGPGLAFLKQRSGADYALEVFGGDGESTGANLFFGNRRGLNHLYAGLIDLATGNVVWLHQDQHDTANFTAKNNMELFVDEIIQDYPDGSVHDSTAPH